MEIPGLNDTGSQQSGMQAKIFPSKELGRDEFLRLLVAQLSNQDPMNPLQGHEFAAQLAQFSSVEQLIQINETLQSQGTMRELLAQSINNGIATGLIGKVVEADDSVIEWEGYSDVPLNFTLDAPATSVKVSVVNDAGVVVREYDLQNVAAGSHSELRWDGRDSSGATAPPGMYSFEINATDDQGNRVTGSTSTSGRVDRVTFGPDGVLLWIGGKSIPMSSVRSVSNDS